MTSKKPPLCKFVVYWCFLAEIRRVEESILPYWTRCYQKQTHGERLECLSRFIQARYRDLGIIRDNRTLLKLYLQVLLINKTLTKSLPCKNYICAHHLCKFTVSPFGNKYGVAYPRETNAFDVSTQYSSSLAAANQSGSAMTFLIDCTSGTEYSIKQSKSAKSQAGRYFPRSSFVALFNVGGVTN